MVLRFLFAFVGLWVFCAGSLSAQQKAVIHGTVTDTVGNPVSNVLVTHNADTNKVHTNEAGQFSLSVPAQRTIVLRFRFLKLVDTTLSVPPIAAGGERSIVIQVIPVYRMDPITIKEGVRGERQMMERVEIKRFEQIPNPSGGVEGLLKTLPSVSSNNELSSQYSVRGGNYDENLVYINDVEVFRPFLTRAGQQEGLSIINSDLVQSLYFSAGGFEARYGDKMSSVLDIQYREADSFRTKVGVSLLGASLQMEGSTPNRRLRFLGAARYRSNAYLLRTLDVDAEFRPVFADVQGLLSYDLNPEWRLEYLGYYGSNHFVSIPQSQETTFGTVSQVLRLRIFFDGQEIISQRIWLNALTLQYKPSSFNRYKLIFSNYGADEQENFDVIGAYSLQELETDPSSENFGDVRYTLGDGAYLDHARNRLLTQVFNGKFLARHEGTDNLNLNWGFQASYETFDDRLREYHYIDSADFSVPQDTDHILQMYDTVFTRNTQAWMRAAAFVQNNFTLSDRFNSYLNVGLRGNYWGYNGEVLLMPRVQWSFEPNAPNYFSEDTTVSRSDLKWQVAAGAYHQPPFYRELRGITGQLNPEIRAQRSYQVVGRQVMTVRLWKRPYRWTTELYYKHLTAIIPYELDNVRVRYYADNNAKGYATGLEMQLYGEFVQGISSWASFALMQTKEDIFGDTATLVSDDGEDTTRYAAGYIPRPTDQRFRIALFFQDYLPNNPTYKAHLNMVYASGLPWGPPDYVRHKDTLRMKAYWRVDIGFSKQLAGENQKRPEGRLTKGIESAWLSVELFNLFDINNTIGYFWVRDVGGGQWAIPRYLTGRRLNIQLQIQF